MTQRRAKWWGIGVAGVLLLVGGAVVLYATLSPSGPLKVPEKWRSKGKDKPVAVRTTAPLRVSGFEWTVTQPADVLPYYHAGLRSRVPGQVIKVEKALGAPVKKGEVLVEVGVPELEAEVERKEALITQRQQEWELAKAKVKIEERAVAVAKTLIPARIAEVAVADATLQFRTLEYERFKGLVEEDAATKSVRDERQKFRDAARAAVAVADAAVKKAEADHQEAIAKKDAAMVDERLKEKMVRVAEKDRDHALAFRNFARIEAPFDGVVAKRSVDEGALVQNGTNSKGEPLMVVERTDIITVHMNVPDTYAPFVHAGTEARIEVSTESGTVTLLARLMRRAPSLREKDRTLPVEVDLYNRPEEDYKAFVAQARKSGGAGLKDRTVPMFPTLLSGAARLDEGCRLKPGTYGTMTLVLKKYPVAYLLPRRAVFSEGNTSFVCLVQDNKARRVRAHVQQDDGERVKVTLIEQVGGRQRERELAGDEEVIVTNPSELRDGQAVQATRAEG
jgi:multidrug resistance efflux pump